MIYFSYQSLQTQDNKTIEIGDLLYMNSMKRYALLMTLLSLLYSAPYGMAADAGSFRTEEYQAIGENVFDLIHAADAYAQGYTGKGVTVGVTDVSIVNFTHPEFAGKDNNTVVHDALNGDYGNLTWANLNHATHVAGIVAANKDGAGMHGVAYDAGIASSSAAALYGPVNSPDESPAFSLAISMYDYYLANPDIKIINNSWGFADKHLFDVQDKNDFYNLQNEAVNDDGFKAVEKAVHNDKLLVFAALNEGNLTAAWESDFDILTGDKAFNDNIITVTAAKADSFTKNENDSFDVKSDAIAVFSNLAMYNEDTALSAPGWNITSANADFENPKGYSGYLAGSGTSAAAPIVSGVGALVQQAFPYLGGKQIGDVLLSTANNDITNTDGYFVNHHLEYENDNYKDYYNIFITGNDSNLSEEDSYQKGWSELYNYLKNNEETVVTQFFGNNKKSWEKRFGENGYIKSAEDLKNRYQEYMGATAHINIYINVPMDVIFGQGIVDAGKAVNGLGAINVRRLDSSDISDKYSVVANDEYTEKQALYKVDTQGYNSVWSNDISEIRAGYIAENPLTGKSSVGENTDNSGYDETSEDFEDKFAGLTDLHNRWVFYTTNNFDDNPVGSDEHNWMTNHYMEQYNKWVEESGLAGLHAGLYKTGEGVLALTGNNTYKGASIAAGGTLQIDGSVAGDAYSEGDGTIAGSGTIEGSLYNDGAVKAGSWDAVADEDGNVATLYVAGNFSGSGAIVVNTDGTNSALIHVDKKADVSAMNLKAGLYAAPDVTGTILQADQDITGAESLNGAFSGLLNSEVQSDGQHLELTTTASNNAGIAADQFAALNGLYGALNEDEQKDMHRLYALDNDALQAAMTAQNQSASMHLELAYDAMQNRDVRQAVRQQERTDREDAVWAITGKGWGSMDDGLKRHSWNAAVGYDFYDDGDTYAGALVAYSDNSLSGYDADGTYKNYSVGLYGGTKNRPGTATAYVSYGRQENELTRYLGSTFSHSGASSKVTSDYDSTVFGVGATYAYDLHYGKEAGWHVSPYVGLDYAHYQQDSFGEDGSVFALRSGGFSDDYLTGELGVDMKRETNGKTYGLSVAYRRVFDGDAQHTRFSYAKGNGIGFGVQSMNHSKDHVVASAYASAKLSDHWEIGGAVEQDWSHTSRDLSAAVNVAYRF